MVDIPIQKKVKTVAYVWKKWKSFKDLSYRQKNWVEFNFDFLPSLLRRLKIGNAETRNVPVLIISLHIFAQVDETLPVRRRSSRRRRRCRRSCRR